MRLIEFCTPDKEKYRRYYWFFFYFGIAFECDARILAAFLHTLPWFMEEHSPPGFVKNLYFAMRDAVRDMQLPRTTPYRYLASPDMGLSYRSPGGTDSFNVVYDDAQPSVELRLDSGGNYSKFQLDCRGRYFWIRVMSTTSDLWMLDEERLRFLTYAEQIERFMKLFMSFDPDYWKQRNPLPNLTGW
jgi:hypothetical protein